MSPGAARIEWLEQVDSTSEEAHRRAEAGEAGPLWIAAREQTRGRGRRGRAWLSAPGDLKASLLLTPAALRPGVSVAETATLSFVAGLALHDALGVLAPAAACALKWPNDLLADGRKIAGLLLEGRGPRLVIGVGLNLVSRPEPAALEPSAWDSAALAEFTRPAPPPEDALLALAAAFERRLAEWRVGGFGAIRPHWLARAARLGHRIAARTAHERAEGRFADIDSAGALVLETEGGRRVIHAAEVFFPDWTDRRQERAASDASGD